MDPNATTITYHLIDDLPDRFAYLYISLVITTGIYILCIISERLITLFHALRRRRHLRETSRKEDRDAIVKESQQRSLRIAQLFSDYERTPVYFLVNLASLLLNLVSCALFLYLTIQVSDGNEEIFYAPWCINIHFAISIIQFAHIIHEVVLVRDKLKYILSLLFAIELVALVPGILGMATGYFFYGLEFVYFIRIFGFILFLEKRNYINPDRVMTRLVIVGLTVLSVMVSAACLIFVYENIYETGGSITNMLDAIYFIIVTSSTVGYGDYSPKTPAGKVIVMGMIIVGIAIFPIQLSKLAELITADRDNVHYKSSTSHVVVSTAQENVDDVLEEFFHEDRKLSGNNMVILSPHPRNLKIPVAHTKKVFLLHGNLTNKHAIQRSRVEAAKAVILLSDKSASNQEQADAETILECIVMNQYQTEAHAQAVKAHSIAQNKRIGSSDGMRLMKDLIDQSADMLDTDRNQKRQNVYVQILRSQNKTIVEAIPCVKRSICVEEYKMALLARSCVVPGFIVVISNLIRSVSASDDTFHGVDSWVNEYGHGVEQELYTVDLSPLAGLSFHSLCQTALSQIQVILIGIKNKKGFYLNPGKKYIITEGDFGFCIATDEDEALKIREDEIFNMSQSLGQEKPPKQSKWDRRTVRKKLKAYIRRSTSVKHESTREDLLKTPPSKLMASTGQRKSSRSTDEIETEEQRKRLIKSRIRWCCPDITNHVLITGSLNGLNIFLETLCDSVTEKTATDAVPRVVIINEDMPSTTSWDVILKYKHVHFVQGSPLDNEALQRANIAEAQIFLILKPDNAILQATTSSSDARNILIFRNIRDFKDAIIDLGSGENSGYLGTCNSPISLPSYNPYFTSGKVYSDGLLDTLICQAFYSPDICDIIKSMLSGGIFSISFKALSEGNEMLQQKTFGELYKWLITHQELIVLGIFRKRPTPNHHLSYPVVNPEPSFKLKDDDMVYCIPVSQEVIDAKKQKKAVVVHPEVTVNLEKISEDATIEVELQELSA
eukprot:TRINITY_DN3238_c0_g1_i1.p1 TRINITY_DN3238_c0_g1~~TRINITY_DN3238_c0_g1_i1.p1  ORF type:complete len:1007 (-),score=300.40 TRINITY_DN3238_c0_g1_i1:109-3129(-)